MYSVCRTTPSLDYPLILLQDYVLVLAAAVGAYITVFQAARVTRDPVQCRRVYLPLQQGAGDVQQRTTRSTTVGARAAISRVTPRPRPHFEGLPSGHNHLPDLQRCEETQESKQKEARCNGTGECDLEGSAGCFRSCLAPDSMALALALKAFGNTFAYLRGIQQTLRGSARTSTLVCPSSLRVSDGSAAFRDDTSCTHVLFIAHAMSMPHQRTAVPVRPTPAAQPPLRREDDDNNESIIHRIVWRNRLWTHMTASRTQGSPSCPLCISAAKSALTLDSYQAHVDLSPRPAVTSIHGEGETAHACTRQRQRRAKSAASVTIPSLSLVVSPEVSFLVGALLVSSSAPTPVPDPTPPPAQGMLKDTTPPSPCDGPRLTVAAREEDEDKTRVLSASRSGPELSLICPLLVLSSACTPRPRPLLPAWGCPPSADMFHCCALDSPRIHHPDILKIPRPQHVPSPVPLRSPVEDIDLPTAVVLNGLQIYRSLAAHRTRRSHSPILGAASESNPRYAACARSAVDKPLGTSAISPNLLYTTCSELRRCGASQATRNIRSRRSSPSKSAPICISHTQVR
ncbi:hypothetical protein B0H13DRAFT_2267421 [Mycena leptocephala]|nr:hypothetical protein B0H13DRAFT_2267421 [Mycena leptocephala]